MRRWTPWWRSHATTLPPRSLHHLTLWETNERLNVERMQKNTRLTPGRLLPADVVNPKISRLHSAQSCRKVKQDRPMVTPACDLNATSDVVKRRRIVAGG